MPWSGSATWLLLGALGAAAFAAPAASLASGGGLLAWDEPAREVAARAAPRVVSLMALVSLLGEEGVVLSLSIAVVALLARRGEPGRAIHVALLVVVAEAAIRITKATFARARPTVALVDAVGYAFPSGHAMAAALLVCVVAWLVFSFTGRRGPRVAAVAFALAWPPLMAASRVVLGVHHLSDVVAGLGLGLAIGGFGIGVPRLVGAQRAGRREAP